MKKYQCVFFSENFQFLEVKFSIYLRRRVFVFFYVSTRLTILGLNFVRVYFVH